MAILVIGGAGYIGSVACEQLLSRGYKVVVLDNLVKGHRDAVPPGAEFIQGDMGDKRLLKELFSREHDRIETVMHFAALSLVGESVMQPRNYYENNVVKGIALLDTMLENSVKKMIFSSTCAIYGEPSHVPMDETCLFQPLNPYGETKLAFEKALKCYSHAYGLKYVALRYFNAAGATKLWGEDHEPETHLIPLVLRVAAGTSEHITIFGDDYDTPDGTCIRDYIHVVDLAEAHLLAIRYMENEEAPGIFNLGNGQGFSVREVIETSEKVTGKKIAYKVGPRREGDPPRLVASSEFAKNKLGWQPKYADLTRIIDSAWQWNQNNPKGYARKEVHV